MGRRENSRRQARIFWLLLALALVGGSPHADAAPCQGPVLMHSQFDELPSVWRVPNAAYYAHDGKLVVEAKPFQPIHNSLGLGAEHDVDVCVNVIVGEPSDASAGISLFGHGGEVLFDVTANGQVQLEKKDGGKWTELEPSQHIDALKPGTETNSLAVEINGDEATFLINGETFAHLIGKIPSGPLILSLVSEASRQHASKLLFYDLMVTSRTTDAQPPPAVLDGDAGCNGAPILQDTLAAKPAIAANDPQFQPVDGKLQMHVAGGHIHRISWSLDDKREVDACVTTTLVSGPGDYAMLTLDGKDGSLEFRVDAARGFAAVFREDAATGKETAPIGWHWEPSIRPGPGQQNSLQVKVSGDTALFYINGWRAGTVNGVLPAGPLQLSLQGAAEKGGDAVWAFGDLAVTTAKAPTLAKPVAKPATKPVVVAGEPAPSPGPTEPAAEAPAPGPAEAVVKTTPPPPPPAAAKPTPAPSPPEPVAAARHPCAGVAALEQPSASEDASNAPPREPQNVRYFSNSCLTWKSEFDREKAEQMSLIYRPVDKLMLEEQKKMPCFNPHVERRLKGWEFCAAEASPLPDDVELFYGRSPLHRYWDSAGGTTSSGMEAYLRVFTTERPQLGGQQYNVLTRPADLGNPVFRVDLDILVNAPPHDVFTGPLAQFNYDAFKRFLFPVKITLDGKVIAEGQLDEIGAPVGDAWRIDLVKRGLNKDALLQPHTLEASYEIPPNFQIKGKPTEVVFYRARLQGMKDVLAAMDAYLAEEMKKPPLINDAVRRAWLNAHPQLHCADCEASLQPQLSPEQHFQKEYKEDLERLKSMKVPTNADECRNLADTVFNVYTEFGSTLYGMVPESDDVTEDCGKKDYAGARQTAYGFLREIYEAQLQEPILKAIDAIPSPKDTKECLALAQQVADVAAKTDGGRDQNNVAAVTQIETDCKKQGTPPQVLQAMADGGGVARGELRRLVRVKHIIDPLH